MDLWRIQLTDLAIVGLQEAWDFAISIIIAMKPRHDQNGSWRALDCHSEIFGKKTPSSLS